MPCVLIVEDDADLRELMQHLLRTAGYETCCAGNGRDALDQMQDCKPALVLLDLHMPVMDGFEFRRRQLADPGKADVPVVAVTAHYDPHEVEARLHIKCLHKPLSVDHILTELQQACEGGRV
ncbi:MAG TPA: response regulator [Vicinamibacterales bacterium]|nr:response regulator [Vicinamibacterales bacterium]